MKLYQGKYNIWGPPGTGKTTFLVNQVRKILEAGGQAPLLCSLTRTAASEIASRDLPLARDQIGTLHSHAYRALDRPQLAESKIEEFNEAFPEMQLDPDAMKKSGDVDEPMWDQEMQTHIGAVWSRYQILRARLIPAELWPDSVVELAKVWVDWKKQNEYIDFTDMIEIALADVDTALGNPEIIIGDEAQDYSALEFALLDKWGKAAGTAMYAGDPFQALYTWRGADPELFFDPAVAEDHRITLSQSHRLPETVHAIATTWVQQLSNYRSVSFKPRKDDEGQTVKGEVVANDATWIQPESILPVIEYYIGRGKTVMIAASCSYLLGPTLDMLRARAIPFSNRWRLRRGDWNPLRLSRGVGMAERILAYLVPDETTWGKKKARHWTIKELMDWTTVLAAKGLLKRGSKKRIKFLVDENAELDVDESLLFELFEGEQIGEYLELLIRRNNEGKHVVPLQELLAWWKSRLLGRRRRVAEYALRVAIYRGPKTLQEKPRCYIGTIHSFKGAEADCSPGDELILTQKHGWVPIARLNPEIHRLISFDSDHHKIYRGGPRRPNGYKFKKGVRVYDGQLLTIETQRSKTRLTPNHHVLVRWRKDSLNKFVVYIMRRNNWWRIGITHLRYFSNTSRLQYAGLPCRLSKEKGDAIWAINVFNTRREACFYEQLMSHLYHIPDLNFELQPRSKKHLSTNDLIRVWGSIDSETGAKALLNSLHLNPLYPLFTRKGTRARQTGMRNRWIIRACNLNSKLMELPVDPGKGQLPLWLSFTVQRSSYQGLVYSLDVEKWHYYISNGTIVHNCVILYPDLSPSGMREWQIKGKHRDNVIRTFYVGLTRAREVLVLCKPGSGLYVDL